jgi:hypothetical protein
MATEEIDPVVRRLNERYRLALEGIAFGMKDRNGTPVKCFVTNEAITDRLGGVPRLDQQVEWLRGHRREVESIASEKFAAAEFSDGEFNPHRDAKPEPDRFDL